MASLANLLTDTAAQHGDRPALKLDDAVVTYAQLDEGAARVAGLLKGKGLRPGDRVGVMLPNVPYFAVVYYGVLRAGGVVVPMNPLLKGREVAFYLGDPEARFLCAWHGFAIVMPRSHRSVFFFSPGARLRRARPRGRRGGGRRAVSGRAGQVRAAARPSRGGPPGRGARRLGHRRDPVHVRHDRHAEGRRAHARQP